MKNPEEIDPDWARYSETILVFPDQEKLEVDLRKPVTAQLRAELKTRGFVTTFAILTAHDPEGQNLSPDENRARQNELESDLARHVISFTRVDACSIDRTHCECSVAIDVDQQVALDIATRFRQMAIFWYDGDSFCLIGALVKSDPVRLPRTP